MQKDPKNILYPFIKDLAGEVRERIIFLSICIIFSRMLMAYLPTLYAKIIDQLSASVQLKIAFVPFALIVAYGAVKFLSAAFLYLQEFAYAIISERISKSLRLNVFNHLHTLSHEFHL